MDKENKKEITTIPELAIMINNGFQSNQDYMDKRFEELKVEIKRVDTKLARVDAKLTTFIDDYHSEKLPMRVEYIENALNFPKK